jgi:hypothetical protein
VNTPFSLIESMLSIIPEKKYKDPKKGMIGITVLNINT